MNRDQLIEAAARAIWENDPDPHIASWDHCRAQWADSRQRTQAHAAAVLDAVLPLITPADAIGYAVVADGNWVQSGHHILKRKEAREMVREFNDTFADWPRFTACALVPITPADALHGPQGCETPAPGPSGPPNRNEAL